MTDENNNEITPNEITEELTASLDEAGKLFGQNVPENVDALVAGLKRGNQPAVIDNMVVYPPDNKWKALHDVREAEEKQRKLRTQYEKDKLFYEQTVLKKSRSVGEIQEDYIKVLHPYYREKFLAGISQYGTVPAAMKYMKDTYGLKLRGDVLRRMTMLIPVFKQEVEDALAEYQATLQIEMHRRAVDGIDRGVYFQGECIGTEKQYSDVLLAKMVDTHNPEYKETKQKNTEHGNVINVQIIKDFHNYKGD